MELQVGVKILLKNSEGKFLLLKRSPKKYPEVLQQWDLAGGRINPGSPLIDNLKREIKEETQLDYEGQSKLVAAQDILRKVDQYDRHIVRLTYTGRIEGEPVLDEDHDDYRWFTFDEIKKLSAKELDNYFKELVDSGVITENSI